MSPLTLLNLKKHTMIIVYHVRKLSVMSLLGLNDDIYKCLYLLILFEYLSCFKNVI